MEAPVSPFEGILLVNKPSGPTSYDMIRWVKRAVNAKLTKTKIGHCGTLDPLASGLLVLLLGKATKRQSLYMGHDKTYRCRMKMGVSTDSGDVTGQVKQNAPVPALEQASVEKVFSRFLGDQSQIPPMYSALKKDGAPLYKLARKGVEIERAPRAIRLHSIEWLSFPTSDEIEFRVRCSPGTYVRTLIEDLGKEFGTVATMSALEREAIGDLSNNEAVPGDFLREMSATDLRSRLRPLAN